MPDYQLRLGIFSKSYADLTDNEKEFINYFLRVKMHCISNVIDSLDTTGPHGYGSSLVLTRIIKIKMVPALGFSFILGDDHMITTDIEKGIRMTVIGIIEAASLCMLYHQGS